MNKVVDIKIFFWTINKIMDWVDLVGLGQNLWVLWEDLEDSVETW